MIPVENSTTLRPEWNIFIEAFVANDGDHIAAYQKAYPTASRLTASTKGKKLLRKNDIDIRIKELLKKKSDIIDQEREVHIKEAAKTVLTVDEVDATLYKIIKQEHETEKIFINRAGTALRIKVKPSQKEILTAINIFYERFGHKAPDKITEVPHDPFAGKTEDELLAIIKQNKGVVE